MTEKKHHKHAEEETGEFRAEAVEEKPENPDQANLELEALMKRLEEAETKVAEHLDGWQRAQADFINYKSRVQRDQDLMRSVMKGDIIKKFLPVLDDLERALQNRPSDSGSWMSGIELIHKKLQSILESEGVTRIEAEGQLFDPNFHEAISHEPSEAVESGHVIAVVQNGYLLGERVIRPALVRVAQ
ncbi:MAG TPA: nucleotide exchange factor GrpE [Anaerolineales bacterium]|nr:nucleotide exchange factor GrpE [Anaerolineales bacterium]